MKSFKAGEVTVDVLVRQSEVTLIWRGQSLARDPNAVLSPPLNDIAAALTDSLTVTSDFRGLDYMNSSSVRPVLTFLQAAATRARQVRVVYAAEKNWQRLSFMAMRAVLATAKNVVFEP